MYKVHALKPVTKDLKKLSRQATDHIANQTFSRLAQDPEAGRKLKGELRDYWKLAVSFQGVTYRIIYQISQTEKVVLIIAVGSREGFYDRLLRRLR